MPAGITTCRLPSAPHEEALETAGKRRGVRGGHLAQGARSRSGLASRRDARRRVLAANSSNDPTGPTQQRPLPPVRCRHARTVAAGTPLARRRPPDHRHQHRHRAPGRLRPDHRHHRRTAGTRCPDLSARPPADGDVDRALHPRAGPRRIQGRTHRTGRTLHFREPGATIARPHAELCQAVERLTEREVCIDLSDSTIVLFQRTGSELALGLLLALLQYFELSLQLVGLLAN